MPRWGFQSGQRSPSNRNPSLMVSWLRIGMGGEAADVIERLANDGAAGDELGRCPRSGALQRCRQYPGRE